MKLGVNVDHVATLREARKIEEPCPVYAALLCEKAGCDLITAHLREDRRHMQDDDIYNLQKSIKTKLNLEMSCAEEIVDIALDISPYKVTLVPEKREEVTTEGGLDVLADKENLKKNVDRMHEKNIIVSLFVDPEEEQIKASCDIGADEIEIHTGSYANAENVEQELARIKRSAMFGKKLGLKGAAGHGLNYENVQEIVKIDEIEELNIGHSIIARSVFVGIENAVEEMVGLLK